jgi:hypothetical protein
MLRIISALILKQKHTSPMALTLFPKNGSAHPSPRCFVRARNNPVHCAPVVPHRDRSHGPLPPHSVVISRMDMVVEEIQQLIRFGFFELRETCDETVVHIQGFQARDRVGADCWVVSINGSAVGSNTPEVEDCIVWKFTCQ